jgi:hypothetical protein
MGGVVLLVTLVLAVVVIGAARRPATAGTADVAPFPDPPPVGSCLSRSGLGYVTVPCTERHLVEVTRSWSGWEWDSRGVSGTGADQLCDLTAGSYLGKPGSIEGWTPIALPWLTVFASGPGEETGPWGWRACGVFPRAGQDQLETRPGFRGSLSGASTMAARPPELRTCYAASASAWMLTPCSAAHQGEFLAERSATGADGAAADDRALLASCREVAAQLIGADVGADSRVRLALRYLASSREGEVVGGAAPNPIRPNPIGPNPIGTGPSAGGTVRCAIETTGDHHLAASVIGLGGAPLPVS